MALVVADDVAPPPSKKRRTSAVYVIPVVNSLKQMTVSQKTNLQGEAKKGKGK